MKTSAIALAMNEKGYIKFQLDWTRTGPLDLPLIAALSRWRRPLFEAELIGFDPDQQLGFGNLSARVGNGHQFVISGTSTGHLPVLDARHFALVTAADPEHNRVACEGPIAASSESMTHAAIYALDASIHAVVHVHDATLWRALFNRVPTTDAAVAYGTPQMALELRRLYAESRFRALRIAVMGGHCDGLIAIGASLSDAVAHILAPHRRLCVQRSPDGRRTGTDSIASSQSEPSVAGPRAAAIGFPHRDL
jgi:L-ribulose-5-phosphate 4-epimerase